MTTEKKQVQPRDEARTRRIAPMPTQERVGMLRALLKSLERYAQAVKVADDATVEERALAGRVVSMMKAIRTPPAPLPLGPDFTTVRNTLTGDCFLTGRVGWSKEDRSAARSPRDFQEWGFTGEPEVLGLTPWARAPDGTWVPVEVLP